MSSPKEQKALVVEEPKTPFVVRTIPVPKPGPGEVLVKVMATSLNPVDWFIQAKNPFPATKEATDPFPTTQYPAILGIDVAGDVVQLGEGVEQFSKGDRVFFQSVDGSRDSAGFQQYALSPAQTLGKIPVNISYAQAATFPLTFTTAIMPLFPEHPIGAGLNPTFDPQVSFDGETALVIGGATSVGQFAIQILRYVKYSTIITYASAKHTSYLKSIGATHVVDRAEIPLANLPAAIAMVTSEPIKMVFSAITTPEAQEAGYVCLAKNCGAKIAIAHPMPMVPKKDESGAEAVAGRTVYASWGSPHIEANREFGKLLWQKLPALIEEGIFVPCRVENVPNGLHGIADGLQKSSGILDGSNRGVSGVKLVAYPQETA